MTQPTPDLGLPADLIEFLRDGKQLEYDAGCCEAGTVTLLPLAKLKLQRFPVETSSSELFEHDPHYPDVNSYLVLAVDLIGSCTGDYGPEGLLLWLPIEKRYGVWDSSHCTLSIFGPEITWQQISNAPAAHINAGWSEMHPESPEMTELVPWLSHPYGNQQVHEPQPA